MKVSTVAQQMSAWTLGCQTGVRTIGPGDVERFGLRGKIGQPPLRPVQRETKGQRREQPGQREADRLELLGVGSPDVGRGVGAQDSCRRCQLAKTAKRGANKLGLTDEYLGVFVNLDGAVDASVPVGVGLRHGEHHVARRDACCLRHGRVETQAFAHDLWMEM